MENSDSSNKRTELIKIGLDFMTKNGSTNFSIKEIATEAQIAVGLFYYYFPSKEAFIAEAIGHYMNNFAQQAQAILCQEHLTVKETIKIVFETLVGQMQSVSHLMISNNRFDNLRFVLPFAIVEGIRPHLIKFLEAGIHKKEIVPFPPFNIPDQADLILYGFTGILLNADTINHQLGKKMENYAFSVLRIPDGE